METSFCDLRCKFVINVTDGRCLGKIIDVVFETRSGRICGFVVPGNRHFFNWFKACEDIYIPYNCICKIGEDSILVELFDCHGRVRTCETAK